MPVTAKLSRKFYEKLGDDVANELVEWFNLVDATYRSDLRELNELNFARFDAKVEQRFAEFETKFELRLTELDRKSERRIRDLDTKLERCIAEVRAEMQAGFGHLEARLEKRLGDQTRFFFLAWAILLASNIALWFR